MMSSAALPRSRYTVPFPCPICEGHERMPRGEQRRCHGYVLEIEPGRQLAYCSRIPSSLPSPSGDLWAHWLDGERPSRRPVRQPKPAAHATERKPWSSRLDPYIRSVHNYGVFEVVRFDRADCTLPKCIVRNRDERGRMWFGLPIGMSATPLYRERQPIEALAAGTPVYIVEGESDADAIAGAGATATCNPFGAGKFRAHHARALAAIPSRAAIRVVRDMDDPGLCHAQAVRRSLLVAGVDSARIQMLQPATGHDVRDHLAAGQSLAALRRWGAGR